MKRLCLSKKSNVTPLAAQTKKGVASLYVVMFVTLLFGVITVSFARIILSEAAQSSNDDLSRSAYDAALAGVEDAKTYVNKYYDCIKENEESTCETQYGIFSTKYVINNGTYTDNESGDWKCDPGFPLGERMGYTGEVLIQEGNANSTDGEFTDQAYTCVLVSDVVPDYRGTLSKDTRTKVIPLGIYRGGDANNNGQDTGSNLSGVTKVRFSWYSDMNRGTAQNGADFDNLGHGGKFYSNEKKTVPPTIQLNFIYFQSNQNLDTTYHQENTSHYDSTMVFLPSDTPDLPNNRIGFAELQKAGNAYTGSGEGAASTLHNPYQISCTADAEFACTVEIELPKPMSDTDTAMLVASLPYADAYTDFAVTLLKDDGRGGDSVVYLKGVQISVDSTGRTNQLVRRVEARLDPADLFFPYPQYALELGSDPDGDSLTKSFWVTTNCWYSQPSKGGIPSECPQNGKIDGSSGSF